MYYKKLGNKPPYINSGCVYEESYFHDGYLYLKYSVGNVPSEELPKITQEEYEVNKPIIPEPEPTPTEQEAVYADLMATMNEILLKLNGGGASV